VRTSVQIENADSRVRSLAWEQVYCRLTGVTNRIHNLAEPQLGSDISSYVIMRMLQQAGSTLRNVRNATGDQIYDILGGDANHVAAAK
jgi:hypothetical protein